MPIVLILYFNLIYSFQTLFDFDLTMVFCVFNRYEQPAPWDDEYKKYIATTPLVQIDRSLVIARDPKH